MIALKSLASMQTGRGKNILFSVLDTNRYFTEIYKDVYHRVGIDAPFLVTSYFKSKETSLPHDGHPNRFGHGILANHYIHAFNALGWVPVPEELLPRLDARLSVDFNPAVDAAALGQYRRAFAGNFLRLAIDFGTMKPFLSRTLLGGIFPEQRGRRALSQPPWASTRSAFLLQRPEDRSAKTVEIQIEIPARVELFPFAIDVFLNGEKARSYAFNSPNQTARYTLSAPVPPFREDDLAIEVRLETPSYFAEIVDPRMKSFRLLSATIE